MAKVLVTGARGFLGTKVVERLRKHGWEVHAITSRVPALSRGMIWHSLNLLDGSAEGFAQRLGASHLVHLAWETHPGYWSSPKNSLWREASEGLIRGFRAGGGKRVVVTGTCAEYDWNATAPLDETASPLRPASLYGIEKHRLQEWLRAGAFEDYAWARVFFPYGPGQPTDKLIPSAIAAFRQGQPFECRGANLVRDYIYLEDVADILVSLLDQKLIGTINVGTGTGIRVGDLVREIAMQMNAEELVRLADDTSSPKSVIASSVRLQSIHHQRFTAPPEGIRSTISAMAKEMSYEFSSAA